MLLSLKNAAFKQFKQPINLDILASQRWAIVGADRAKLLEILAGSHVPSPPTARKYVWGHEFWPTKVIQRIEFGDGAQSQAPYLAARFESFRDEFDYSLRETLEQRATPEAVDEVLKLLKLDDIADRWAVGLSNGQSRRAQIAQALLKRPKLLIVNDPFLGVDPANRELLDRVLHDLQVPVVLGLCSSQAVPKWITHLAVAEESIKSGPKDQFDYTQQAPQVQQRSNAQIGAPVLDIPNLSVRIKSNPIFENLRIKVHQGERLHLRGPNGSGKSTLIAVITADHPQGWSEDIRMFGHPREVGKDSYISINRQIGHTSPEIHAIFPKRLLATEAIATGYNGDFIRRKDLSEQQNNEVEGWISRIGVENAPFGDLNKRDQKLVLLARALIKAPQLLLLDEAFSTFDEATLQLANDILDEYSGAVILIGHNAREIPPCDSALDMADFTPSPVSSS